MYVESHRQVIRLFFIQNFEQDIEKAQYGSCMLSFGICQIGHAVKSPVENAVSVDQDQLLSFFSHSSAFLSFLLRMNQAVRRYSSILVI